MELKVTHLKKSGKKNKGGAKTSSFISNPGSAKKDSPTLLIDRAPTDTFKCVFPMKIHQIMLGLDNLYKDVEYSILCKAKFNKVRKRFELTDEYFIPEQEVTSTFVDYKEDKLNYNCVIHKHPNGCKQFSGTDETYINRNFELSLLWVNGGFEYGIANIFCEPIDSTIRLKIVVEAAYLEPIYPSNHAEKIHRKTYVQNHGVWAGESRPPYYQGGGPVRVLPPYQFGGAGQQHRMSPLQQLAEEIGAKEEGVTKIISPLDDTFAETQAQLKGEKVEAEESGLREPTPEEVAIFGTMQQMNDEEIAFLGLGSMPSKSQKSAEESATAFIDFM